MFRSMLVLAVLAGSLLADDAPPYPVPKTLGPVETYGRHLARSMDLMASSTPQQRNTVRVLFYGQSITEQDWTRRVTAELRRRFPHANLVIENRAIGGFASQLLVKTAETDLYPFYPDLLIFHVYGSHLEYENILRRVRERTTADILQQTDHLSASEGLDEPTDPARLTPRQWSPWMNYQFLPAMAKKYGTELVDQRGLWKRYLADHKLTAKDLLRDGVHLNDHGCYLMAEIVQAYLRPTPGAEPAQWRERVRTYRVGTDVTWKDGRLTLDFVGNRIDVVCRDGTAAPAEVRIDGKKPSAFPELVALTRTTAYPGSNWPCLLRVGAEKPRLVEDWTLTITAINDDLTRFRFRVAGSKTGEDGEGESGQRFVSNSGRVVIEPDDWNFGYARKVFRRSIRAPFAIRWKVRPQYADTFVSPGVKEATVETTVTLAQGLPGGTHRLEVRGTPTTPIAAIRVYQPPLHSTGP